MVQDGNYQYVKQQDRGRDVKEANDTYALSLRKFHYNISA